MQAKFNFYSCIIECLVDTISRNSNQTKYILKPTYLHVFVGTKKNYCVNKVKKKRSYLRCSLL